MATHVEYYFHKNTYFPFWAPLRETANGWCVPSFEALMSWNKNWRLLPNKIQWAFWLWDLNRKPNKVACIFSLSLFMSLLPFTLFSFLFHLSIPPKLFISDLFLSLSWILRWILCSMSPLSLLSLSLSDRPGWAVLMHNAGGLMSFQSVIHPHIPTNTGIYKVIETTA